MTLRYRDRVVDVSTTTGTGTLTLGALPPAGYRDFSAFPTGSTIRYTIVHANNSEWEVGEGVWTTSGATLTRVTVFASSNAGALVNFTAGAKTVSASPVARDVERPAFRVNRTSNQTITGGSWNKIQLATIEFDTIGAFDATTNYRYTPTVRGYYSLNGQVRATTAGNLAVGIYKNGTLVSCGSNNSTNTERSFVSDIVHLNGSSDYVELWVFSSTSQIGPGVGTADCFLSGALTAPA